MPFHTRTVHFPAYAGHFPGAPLVPGAALLTALDDLVLAVTGTRLGRLGRVRFLGPVVPGEAITLRVGVITASPEGDNVSLSALRAEGGEVVLRGVGWSAPRMVSGSGMAAVLRSEPRLASPVWGGHRLAAAYNKGADPTARIGESWEVWRDNLVLPPDGPEGAPRRLGEVVDLPLLIKLLDTEEVLSVQVHPDDAAARRLEGAPNGKAEGWVILAAAPGARIAYGLTRALSADELRARAMSGEIAEDLAWIEVVPGDVIDVPPGTIHAIGGGILLYEIQQPADLTYRLYDHGRGRELHLDKAVAVARREVRRPVSTPRTLGPGHTELLRNGVFVVERIEVPAATRWIGERPAAFTVVEGEIRIGVETVRRGESVVVTEGAWPLAGHGVALVGREA